ncbi:MAG: carboxypeptidase-like regulatory domain-containing protein [Planctomycetaceae bacterium]|nr:carboxypeptidase-like regulatory domain-containing protein [Planctomycetaceae bacterium]
MSFRITSSICVGTWILFIIGCHGSSVIKTDYVEGTVTYKGTPVADANIAFSPVSNGSPAYGRTDSQGAYKLQTMLGAVDQGTTPGEYIVIINKSENIPTGKKEIDPDGKEVDVMTSRSLLPTVYSSTITTPLKVIVVSGKNTFDFDLVDSP